MPTRSEINDWRSWRERHTADDACYYDWCRLHWYTVWDADAHEMVHKPYPGSFNILSSRHGWERIWVHCGPSAFYPKKMRTPNGQEQG